MKNMDARLRRSAIMMMRGNSIMIASRGSEGPEQTPKKELAKVENAQSARSVKSQ